MKKLTAAIVLFLLVLAGCTYQPHRITTVRPSQVTRMTVTDIAQEKTVELSRSVDDVETLVKALEAVELEYAGECSDESSHKYRVQLYVKDELNSEIYIDEDGSFCRSGRLRKPKDGSALDLTAFEALFAKKPDVHELEEGVWQPQEQPAELSSPLPASATVRWLSTEKVVNNEEGWDYSVSEIELSGGRYAVVSREDAGAGTQILFGCGAKTEEAWKISYVAQSYEATSGLKLYFNVSRGDGRGMLYCFSTDTETFAQVLGISCSNMVIVSGEDDSGLGWVLYEDTIVAINLSDGSAYEGMSIPLTNVSGMDYIANHFFNTPAAGYDIKYSTLAANGDGTLEITVTQKISGQSGSEWTLKYLCDPARGTITAIE